mmetsp:Transcript_69520/g.193427  ORF Transcript_69520/g.193427 Transcript_69520/m.193427 type:complete len:280 (+) Transcript_69520:63-902(+)
MCWSFQVSALFASWDLFAVALLFLRNEHRDRLYAALILDLAAQEFCQMMLWLYVGTDMHECPAENLFWSSAAAIFYAMPPVIVGAAAYIIQDTSTKAMQRCKTITGVSVVVQVLCFIAWLVYRWFFMAPRCTYAGRCGHLVWGDMVAPEHPVWIIVVGTLPYFMNPMLSPCTRFDVDGRLNGKWSGGGIGIVSLLTILPVIFYFYIYARDVCSPDEGGSVWCWTSVAISVWCLFETFIYRRCVDPTWTPGAIRGAEAGKDVAGQTTQYDALHPESAEGA